MSSTKPKTLEADAEGWSLRPPDKAKTRACLRCSAEFESAWSGERICLKCKRSAAWKSATPMARA